LNEIHSTSLSLKRQECRMARCSGFSITSFRGAEATSRAPARFSSDRRCQVLPNGEDRHQHSVTVNNAPLGRLRFGHRRLTVGAACSTLPRVRDLLRGHRPRPYGPKSQTRSGAIAPRSSVSPGRGVKAVVVACTRAPRMHSARSRNSRRCRHRSVEPGARAAVARRRVPATSV